MDGANRADRSDLRQLVTEFAASAAEHDRTASVPVANFVRLQQARLLALTVPRSFGGHGAGLAAALSVVGAVAEGEPSTALILAMHYLQHASLARSERWPAHLRERVARETVAGVALINALRVEPELGSPARGGLPATVARRLADGWSISGHKIYSTGAPILSWYAVWARTEESEPRVGFWLVPATAPGIRIEESWDHLGMRATGSHGVIFDGTIVTADHAVDIRRIKDWTPDPMQVAWNVVLVSAVYDGIAQAAARWLRRYLAERSPSNLGAPLATLPRFQSAVGEIEALLATNRRLLQGVAAEVDGELPPSTEESGTIKRTVTNNAVAILEIALSLTGNPGLSRKNPLERHYRDVLCGRVHTPQEDGVLLAAGRAALGI